MVEGGDPARNSHRRRDPTVGRRAPEGGDTPLTRPRPTRYSETRRHDPKMVRDRARGRADRTGVRTPRGCGGAASLSVSQRRRHEQGRLRSRGGWGVPVAESVLAPPGPIPNPVVTQRSAGEYCGGDPTGGEAAAGTPHPPWGRRSGRRETDRRGLGARRGVEQRQLVGLITQRSGVRIPPPLPYANAGTNWCRRCCYF